jgi:ribose/xylose/arabinose/galactoside ABC-type transport system permease subunit
MSIRNNNGNMIFSVISFSLILGLFVFYCGPVLDVSLCKVYLSQASVICFAVLGTIIIYATSGLDLASGGQIYIGMIVFSCCIHELHLPLPAAILLLILFSGLIALIHHFFSTVLGINTIIYTLALQVIFTGAGNLLLPYAAETNGGNFSAALENTVQVVQVLLIIGTGIMVFSSVYLRFTATGRSFMIAHILTHFPDTNSLYKKVSRISFFAGSLLFSCSSVFLFSRMHGYPVQISPDYSYDILAGMFLGGCNFRHMVRTALIGSIAIVLLNAVLLLTGLSAPMELLIKAAVIFIGCYFSQKKS